MVSMTTGLLGFGMTETWVYLKLDEAIDKIKAELTATNGTDRMSNSAECEDWVKEELDKIDKPIEEN